MKFSSAAPHHNDDLAAVNAQHFTFFICRENYFCTNLSGVHQVMRMFIAPWNLAVEHFKCQSRSFGFHIISKYLNANRSIPLKYKFCHLKERIFWVGSMAAKPSWESIQKYLLLFFLLHQFNLSHVLLNLHLIIHITKISVVISDVTMPSDLEITLHFYSRFARKVLHYFEVEFISEFVFSLTTSKKSRFINLFNIDLSRHTI